MLPNQYNPETDPQEAARAAGTMLRTGTVVEVDTARALLRFKTGDITTDWLPWFETRAGGARGGRTWWPPVVGEQGMLIAPGGDLARAVVLPGMFSSAMPAGSADADTMRIDFDEADRIEYQRGQHRDYPQVGAHQDGEVAQHVDQALHGELSGRAVAEKIASRARAFLAGYHRPP